MSIATERVARGYADGGLVAIKNCCLRGELARTGASALLGAVMAVSPAVSVGLFC